MKNKDLQDLYNDDDEAMDKVLIIKKQNTQNNWATNIFKCHILTSLPINLGSLLI